MNKQLMLLMRLVVLAASVSTVTATTGFNFGRGSGIIVADGGTLDLTNGASITDGFIEKAGGDVEYDCSNIDCVNATFIDRDSGAYSSVTFDGTFDRGTRLVLDNNDVLTMNGSPVLVNPIVEGSHCSPSIIRGIGSSILDGEIVVETDAKVIVDLSGVLNANINLQADRDEYSINDPEDYQAVVSLANDLTFAPTYGPITTDIEDKGLNTILFNGHRMTLGGDVDNLDSYNGAFRITHPQVWTRANVELIGPMSMGCSGRIIFDGPAYINGNGNTWYMNDNEGFYNGVNDVTLVNITLSGDDSDDWFDDSEGHFNCINTTLIADSNSITVNGSFYGSDNVFDDNTYWGHKDYVYYNNVSMVGVSKLTNGNGDDITDGSRQVYTDNESGQLMRFDRNGNRILLEIVSTFLLDGEAYVAGSGSQHALVDEQGREVRDSAGFVVYVDDVTDQYLRYASVGEGLYEYRVTTIAFNRIYDFLYVPFMNNHATASAAIVDTERGNRAVYYANSSQYFEFDGNDNPVVVEITTTPLYSEGQLIEGSGSYNLVGYDRNGISIYIDNNTSAYIQYGYALGATEMYHQVSIAFSIVFDSNGHVETISSYDEADADETDTLIKLNSDVYIDCDWIASEDTTLTIDLAGHALDLDDGSLRTDGCDATIIVKNGVLKNVGCNSLDFQGDSTLILDNVEVRLNSHVRWEYANLTIKGKCRFVGSNNSVFENQSTRNFRISCNATLTLEDGIVYSHNNDGTSNFVFADDTSRLELIGATFRRPDRGEVSYLELTGGTIVVDHNAHIQPGMNGIQIGDDCDEDNNLAIIIRPGATLTISSDSCEDVSSGTLIYANVDC